MKEAHINHALYLAALVTGALRSKEIIDRTQAGIASSTPVDLQPGREYTISKLPPIQNRGRHARGSAGNPNSSGTGRARVDHGARSRFAFKSSKPFPA